MKHTLSQGSPAIFVGWPDFVWTVSSRRVDWTIWQAKFGLQASSCWLHTFSYLNSKCVSAKSTNKTRHNTGNSVENNGLEGLWKVFCTQSKTTRLLQWSIDQFPFSLSSCLSLGDCPRFFPAQKPIAPKNKPQLKCYQLNAGVTCKIKSIHIWIIY